MNIEEAYIAMREVHKENINRRYENIYKGKGEETT